jgi:hypothetical protein
MTGQVFSGVDHIMVRVEKAEPFLALFAHRFLLPVSWPLQQMEFASYAWITLGNTNLEFWAAADNTDLPADQALAMFSGFALNPPDLDASIALLEERGIACKPPRAFVTEDWQGKQVTNFTNSVILDVSNQGCCIFFCKWNPDGAIYPWTGKLTAEARQAREQAQLARCGGGPLGITGLAEIRLSSPDVQQTRETWRLMTRTSSDAFDLGRGITLTVCAGATVKVASIVLAVESLAAARAYLASRDLLGDDRGNEIGIARDAGSGLSIWLTQVIGNA